MAINFLSSASVNLAGHNIGTPLEKTFAVSMDLPSRFSRYKVDYLYGSIVTCADLLEADYWVLIIAVCTYLILASHKHQSALIQDHKIVVWVLSWFFSMLWASVRTTVVRYSDIRACKLALTIIRTDKRRVLVHLRPNSTPCQLHPEMDHYHYHSGALHLTVLYNP
jgi:hypothetical protein